MNGTAAKLLLLGSLYLAQGLPHGFFSQAVPALLRAQGQSLTEIGLAMLLMLPWGLKFLWAPLVDRVGSARFGRRRSWIVPLQAGATLGLIALAQLEMPAGMTSLMAGMAVVILFAATQDIAADGLAIALLRPDERGLGNGVQVAAYRLGMIASGGVLIGLSQQLGWAGVFYAMAGMVALTTLPVLLVREPAPAVEARPGRAVIAEFLRRPGVGSWLAVLAMFKFGESFGVTMLRPNLIDRGVSLPELGWILGTAGALAGLAGAMLGGWLVGRCGRWRSLVAFAGLQALAVAGYAALAGQPAGPLDQRLVLGFTVFEHLASGMATVALFTLMMDATRPHAAGTDYTIQASVVVLATGLAAALSGASADRLGYVWHYLLAAGICLLALPAIARHRGRLRRGETEIAGA
ncbi:MAG: MFS transporter [Myxococcales bacterium]|nr:MFS transporter [Myxococcales bacterium]